VVHSLMAKDVFRVINSTAPLTSLKMMAKIAVCAGTTAATSLKIIKMANVVLHVGCSTAPLTSKQDTLLLLETRMVMAFQCTVTNNNSMESMKGSGVLGKNMGVEYLLGQLA